MAGRGAFPRRTKSEGCKRQFRSKRKLFKICFSMKSILKFSVSIFVSSLLITFCNGQPAEIWGSPYGSDKNPGTREQPLGSVIMAQRKAREMRRLNDITIKEGIHIVLKSGTYRLTETILIRPEDSGSGSCPTLFMGETRAKP